jgi:L-ribulose-5-phosphate 4-epimerase
MLDDLRRAVCEANHDLARRGLATLTWGNASGIDRRRGLVVIKPSGVAYDELRPEHMVVVDLDGNTVEGDFKPSSDTATHVLLYRGFERIGGIVHTHSRAATVFAQARREIPCLGTTHADYFHGPVPVTRPLGEDEVAADYEANTGRVIVERFAGVDPTAMPAVLVAGHGPFAWGDSAQSAVENAAALEAVAEMALATLLIDPAASVLEPYLLEKHYLRKHGPAAYYGQTSGATRQ